MRTTLIAAKDERCTCGALLLCAWLIPIVAFAGMALTLLAVAIWPLR